MPFAAVALLLFSAPCGEVSQLTVRLATDKTTYESGETIELELVLENGGSEPVTLEFTTSQRYDFEIRNVDDEVVWRWSDEMGFAQVLGSEIVEPGGRLRYEEEFSMALDAGTYRVIGYITARDVDLRDELAITVQ